MVAYLVPGFGNSGGVRVILEHVNRLKKAGVDVCLISYHEFGKYDIKWFDNEVPIYILKKAGSGVSITGRGGEKLDARSLDAVVVCLWFGIEFLDLMDLKPEVRKYYFIQGRDSMSYEVDHPFILKAEATYKRKDLIPVVVSTWLKGILEKEYGRDDVILAQNGVDFDFWSAPVARESKKKVFLIEGSRHEFHKGIEEALKVCEAVKKVMDIEVWWLTKSDYTKPDCVDQIFSNVDREKCRWVYHNADVLLKPTWHDGWGLPHLEAMASGCALVTTDAGGNMDFCIDKENCLVVPVKDVGAMARNVVYLLEDDEVRSFLIQNGKKTASRFTWDKTIDLLIQEYDQRHDS